MASFPDHFSAASDRYAACRPTYPDLLYEWLGQHAPASARAWDCGTGNGQAAVALRAHFREVIATDPSESQIRHAPPVPAVLYVVATAEASGLAAGSIGLVTVAQALHWFDLPRFYEEVRRVVVPGGVVAAWSYGLLTIDPEIDAIIGRFNKDQVGQYWPPERALVDAGYSGIEFPFTEVCAPLIAMSARWTLSQLGGYLETWSAVTRYRTAVGRNPVPALMRSLRPAWGDPHASRALRWPLAFRVGVVD